MLESGSTRWVPGAALLRPGALVAIAMLVANDRVLKQRFPGLVTGKLSDVCGLVFFPLLLVAVFEWISWPLGARVRVDARSLLLGCSIVTACGFAAVKAVPAASAAYSQALGLGWWVPRAASALAHGRTLPAATDVVVRSDLSDLVALPAVWLAWRSGRQCLEGTEWAGRVPV
ncbi:MAG: hypothetical protein U0V73_02840 [Acidimicrobiia bacterium]